MTQRNSPPGHVGIVGAGVIGMTTAWYLARAGVSVTVVDKGAAGSGCSHANGGWISPSISSPLPAPGLTLLSLSWMLRRKSPLYIQPRALPTLSGWLRRSFGFATRRDYDRGVEALAVLGRGAVDGYRELLEGGIDFEMHSDGLLLAHRSEKKHHEAVREIELLETLGVAKYAVLDRVALLEAEPALRENHVGGVLVTSDVHVKPESLMKGLRDALLREGVTLLENTRVDGLRSDGNKGRCLVTSAGDIEADCFVIAAGAHSGHLAHSCGCPLPMTAGKGYSITFLKPPVQFRRPVTLSEAKVFLTPYEGALRVSGTLEFSGINERLDQRRLAAIHRDASRHTALPDSLTTGVGWVGMRPVVPDTLPVIGRLPTRSNVVMATGHQMLGITLAPTTARAIRDLLLQGAPSVDLAPFSPARF